MLSLSDLNGKFPAAVFIVVLLQTVAAVWWASGLTSTVNAQGEAIKEVKSKVDALTTARVAVLEAEIVRLQIQIAGQLGKRR